MGMHTITDPPILYFGTPVVLISTENEDGSPNLAPMSSAWWLGRRCMLGLAVASIEATLHDVHRIGPDGSAVALEVAVERVHADEDVLAEPDRIDPDA
ncbi:MAG: hypothetical protein QOH83_1149 [Solirubrobacteraceae bacterium]|jgi:flavin reductase (DIM6/NTAB) family NADH-FMN oxidoreductase RutF|nr:hypothetical protein [Solirubrobacteraceae bacterium]